MNKPKNYNEMPNDKFSRGFFKNESEPLYHFRNVFILLPKRTAGVLVRPPCAALSATEQHVFLSFMLVLWKELDCLKGERTSVRDAEFQPDVSAKK